MSNTRNYLGQDINTKNLAPSASESQKGLIEIATTAEAKALADNTRAMTPASIASIIATTAQAQGFTDDKTIITPKKLEDAFKGANQSLSSPGRQKFPGGLIVQAFSLGNTNNAGTGFSSAPLPVAFPNGVIGLTASTRTTSPAFVPYHVSVVNLLPGTISWVVYAMDGIPVSTAGTVTTDFVIFGY